MYVLEASLPPRKEALVINTLVLLYVVLYYSK